MHGSRIPALLITALALAAGLTGCSISVVDTAHPSRSPSPDASVDVKGERPSGPPKPVPQTDAPVTMPDAVSRAGLIAAATTTQRCDGELTLMQDAVAVHVEGPCDRLIVNAQGAQVVADDVTSLSVIGSANVVLAASVRELVVNGDGNIVNWTGSTPAISDIGTANTLKAG
ncbi:DUF3060 domain-containing protein [Microbacterium sp. Au-Mic1]|uniref:DUF3060 domain-containing protein n=1 Tax=Microbacterium sp. Au-Mic1 TaxID=2906457 RepID=UPI001E2BE0F3|nr:DUF3060 domain-containing protein [Microbacterium sp. Au-Mic1]MCE4026550.1 DUF3060 domain-containing protein [Microbacterium sp. Au-Mic1]